MSRRNVSGLVLFAFIVVGTSHASAASRVEDRLVGKVAMSKQALPGKKGDRAYSQALTRGTRGRAIFWEDAKTQSWKIHYAAVVKQPVLDATITIYDVSRSKRLIFTRDKMLYSQSRIVSGTLSLDRDDVFDRNARLLMVVEHGGRVVAQRVFYIQSKPDPRKRDRDISFEAEDTRSADSVEPAQLRSRRRP